MFWFVIHVYTLCYIHIFRLLVMALIKTCNSVNYYSLKINHQSINYNPFSDRLFQTMDCSQNVRAGFIPAHYAVYLIFNGGDKPRPYGKTQTQILLEHFYNNKSKIIIRGGIPQKIGKFCIHPVANFFSRKVGTAAD